MCLRIKTTRGTTRGSEGFSGSVKKQGLCGLFFLRVTVYNVSFWPVY